MSRSRRFLLVLLVASVTCVVLVQVLMDGENIGNTFHYNEDADAKGRLESKLQLSFDRWLPFVTKTAASSEEREVSLDTAV
ncbi:hypothetical protein TNCT_317531 [Trichonephila clavata]|uniref:Uncharacterized protein n=1 Tax=Trichonephila clavata TaxID=2740835 RepID=A0A8X6I6A6_TRICU|nr:hypothetical protein TNCT_317531 [Trichonephila clavata]